MSDFDAEDYESFDLRRGAAGKGPARPDGEVDDANPSQSAPNDIDDDDLDPDDDDADDDDEDDDEDFEDAEPDEIDLVLAAYREDGLPIARPLDKDLANDLEELIVQLRRLPGDAGAIGFVSLVGELVLVVRVRGRMVQTVLSDGGAALEWPIARDVADYLGESDIDDDTFEPIGDLGLLSDVGISDFELEAYFGEVADDTDAVEVVLRIADKIGVGPAVRRVVDSDFG